MIEDERGRGSNGGNKYTILSVSNQDPRWDGGGNGSRGVHKWPYH